MKYGDRVREKATGLEGRVDEIRTERVPIRKSGLIFPSNAPGEIEGMVDRGTTVTVVFDDGRRASFSPTDLEAIEKSFTEASSPEGCFCNTFDCEHRRSR